MAFSDEDARGIENISVQETEIRPVEDGKEDKETSVEEVITTLVARAAKRIDTIREGTVRIENIAKRIGRNIDEETKTGLLEINADAESAYLVLLDEIEQAVGEEQHEQFRRRMEDELALLENELWDGDKQSIAKQLHKTLEAMVNFSKQFDINSETHGLNALDEVLRELNAHKTYADEKVSQIFSDVFYEFSDFLDNTFVLRYIAEKAKAGQFVPIEDATNEVYGRDAQEREQIKRKNREVVAEKIQEFAQEPYLTKEMVVELLKANNRGLVPDEYLRFRSGDNEAVLFGSVKRLGILPADVEGEIDALMDRTNGLIDQKALGKVSKSGYEIGVAKVHNDFLDIHPLSDRNGSTALLIAEVLMAREGYKPPAQRNTNYYDNLRNILGNNPLAIALVAHEQFVISNQAGFFTGGEVGKDPEKRKRHEYILSLAQQRRTKPKTLTEKVTDFISGKRSQ